MTAQFPFEVNSRYTVTGQLGSGGMGTVYQATDSATGQTVAVKHLKSDSLFIDSGMLERFQREGQALRDLDHPNIVKMLDAVSEHGEHYLIMEHMPGGDLRHLLNDGPLALNRVLEIALDLADALTRAHRLNIIHRDLKPANVLLAEDGTPRLTDFGVARIGNKARVTDTGAAVGTIDYLPPEALHGDVIDERADIWSFGVMLYEMLLGHKPFSGTTVAETITAILTRPLPDLDTQAGSIPVDVIDLVYRMLEKDREARIPSIRHVGAALEDILQGRSGRRTDLFAEPRFDTPTPDALQRSKQNLPAQTTPFVGRESELSELTALIQQPKIPLVTVLAPGGMGKTRLAIEAGQNLLEKMRHGVFFVDLSPIHEESAVVFAIAEAISYQFLQDGRDTLDQLLTYLGNKNMLLILDNYEQVLESADIVQKILDAAPDVKVLVTSRERLNLRGEQLLALSGLDFPDWQTPEDALNFAAVKLFVNTAARSAPQFELSTEDLSPLARICRQVAGMPLAIVLAASWVESLTVAEIAVELGADMDILETDLRDIPERQQSIRNVFDTAWNRLESDEQAVFMKTSVFRGGFTRQAAQAVTGAGLRQLNTLVNKSLLRRVPETGRYEIHALLRQYAEDKLRASGELSAIRDAHMNYYADTVKIDQREIYGQYQLKQVRELEADLENVRAAWDWSIEKDDLSYIDRVLDRIYQFITIRTDFQEVLPRIEPLLSRISLPAEQDPTNIIARLELALQVAHYYMSLPLDKAMIEDAIQRSRKTGDRISEGAACQTLGRYYQESNDFDQALHWYEQAMTIDREIDHKPNLADVTFSYAYVLSLKGDVNAAADYNAQALALVNEGENQVGTSFGLLNVGMGLGNLGRLDEARSHLVQSLDGLREIGQPFGLGLALMYIGMFDLMDSDLISGRENLTTAMQVFDELNLVFYVKNVRGLLATLYMLEGRLGEADDQLFLSGEEIAHEHNVTLLLAYALFEFIEGAYGQVRDTLTLVCERLERFTPWDYTTLVIETAMAMPFLGRAERGVELMALGLNVPWRWKSLKTNLLYHGWIEQVMSEISKETFDAAWDRGKTLELSPVVEHLLDEFSNLED